MTDKELRSKFEWIIRNEVYPNSEDMQDYVIRQNECLIELSGERITSIKKPESLGDIYCFEERVGMLRKCLKGTHKCRAISLLNGCKLVHTVCYKAEDEPDWISENPQKVSKLWKRDIKRIIAGYQAMIKQYKRALGGAEWMEEKATRGQERNSEDIQRIIDGYKYLLMKYKVGGKK